MVERRTGITSGPFFQLRDALARAPDLFVSGGGGCRQGAPFGNSIEQLALFLQHLGEIAVHTVNPHVAVVGLLPDPQHLAVFVFGARPRFKEAVRAGKVVVSITIIAI